MSIRKLFLLDIDGCITPPNRGEIDINKIVLLKNYLREILILPNCFLSIYTGRSQEYVEFLSQVLGFVDSDTPCIVENGTALYFPNKKRVVSLLDASMSLFMYKIKLEIKEKLTQNPFEPKENIVTINPLQNQTIEQLEKIVIAILKNRNLIDKVKITHSASSLDILPDRFDKLYGVKYLIKNYFDTKPDKIVAIGDSKTDLEVLKYADRCYIPKNASSILRKSLNSESFLEYEHIDAVIEMMRIEIL